MCQLGFMHELCLFPIAEQFQLCCPEPNISNFVTQSRTFPTLLSRAEHFQLCYPEPNISNFVTQSRTFPTLLPRAEHFQLCYPEPNISNFVTQSRTFPTLLPRAEQFQLCFPEPNISNFVTQSRTVSTLLPRAEHFQLCYPEPNSFKHNFNRTLPGDDLGRDVLTLRKLLKQDPRFKSHFADTVQVGPDVTRPPRSRKYLAKLVFLLSKYLESRVIDDMFEICFS